MLQDAKAFSGFSVDDLDAAKRFYAETLGLEVTDTDQAEMRMLVLRISGSTNILIYPKPDHTPATFTILNFPVDDVEKTVDELTARGVKFEHYDQGGIDTDDKGIHRTGGPLIAWFKDPAGNVLSIIEGAGPL